MHDRHLQGPLRARLRAGEDDGGRENGELIIERAQLRTDNTGLKERVKNKQKELEQEQEKLETQAFF